MITGAVINVFDYMTAAQITDVTSRAETLDVYAPLQAALDAATSSGSAGTGNAVFLPAGTYRIGSTLSIPNSTVFYGEGRQQTVIRPTAGFAGVMITDKGNASKIFLRDFRIEAMAIAGVTHLIKMGYGTSPVAQSEWSNLFFSGGLPGTTALSTCTGIDVVTNVADFTEIEGGYCGTDWKLGPDSTVTTFDRCYSISAVNYGFQLNGSANLINCEIEGPAVTCIGVYVSRETVISGLTYAASLSNPYAIEIDAACPLFSMTGFVNFQTGATALTYVLKDNRTTNPTYWVSNATGSVKNVALAVDDLYLSSDNFNIRSKLVQQFTLRITNTAGTIQQRISVQGVAGKMVSKITGASATLQNTPVGADATTAFAFGGKLSTVTPSVFIFDTAAQVIDEQLGIGTITFNSTTTALVALFGIASFNVNGVTKNRLTVQFFDAASGAAYTVTSIGIGTILDATFMGFLV
jgi:hypothetical protein